MAISKLIFNNETQMDVTGVTVDASKLLDGYTALDSSGELITGSILTKDSSDLQINNNSIIVPIGYYASQASKSVSNGVVVPVTTLSGSSATVSTGTNTLTLSKTISQTPNVTTAGYISSGTAGNTDVSLTASVTTKAAATITPGTTNQTIASGTYLTGTQTISGSSNLTAANIKNGVTIFGVTGTLTGSSYTQIYSGSQTVNTTSTSATSITTVDLGSSYYTSDKIIYVKIRDKAGPRNGYFTGSDAFFFNPYKQNGATTNATKTIFVTYKSSSGSYGTYVGTGTGGYGVYAYSLNSSGKLAIYRRYNSSSSLTINGTYDIKVYTLDYAPAQGNPYNYSSFT